MRCLMDGSTHHTSPDMWRGHGHLGSRLSSGFKEVVDRSDVSAVLGQVIEAKTGADMRSLDRAVAAARSSTLATAVV
jgi:hypothetical protein